MSYDYDQNGNQVERDSDTFEWEYSRPVRLLSVAVGLAALVAAALFAVACEGDTFGIDLTNDTANEVLFEACVRECGSIGRSDRAESGETVRVNGSLGFVAWYRVKSEADDVLGCLKLDFDRYEDVHELRVSRDLMPCP